MTLLGLPDLKVHYLPVGDTRARVPPPSNEGRPAATYAVNGTVRQQGSPLFICAEFPRYADALVLRSEDCTKNTEAPGISMIRREISAQIATVAGQRYGLVQDELRAKLFFRMADPSLIGYAYIARTQTYQRAYSRDESETARAAHGEFRWFAYQEKIRVLRGPVIH